MSQFIEMFKGDNQVPLGDICNIEKGATITRNDVLHGEVPVVAGGQEPSCYHNVANREAGAITVSASGAYAGYINFWNCPIFASDCNTIISKDDEKTDQTFVYFGLRAMQKQIYGLQKGGAQPHVYGKDLQKFMFPCPSYAKQIEFSKMAKQADKSEFVGCKSQFIEMFGNPLSSIQKNELKKLGDCCQINPRRPSVSISDSDLVSFVPMPAVNEDGYIDGATNEEYGKVKKGFTYFENNDVLFAKITPCMENGKGAIAEALTNGIGMGSTEFHVLRPIDGISNPYWLLTLTRMPIFREYAAKNMSGTGGQRRVGAAFLENFMIGLPSISEQETFETIYRQADKSEFELRKSIEAIDQVIKSLINN